MCNYFVCGLQQSENDFIEFAAERIHKVEGNNLSRKDLAEFAHQIFSFFNLSAIYATIKRSADALGSAEMLKIIREVSEELNNPFAYTVLLQCEMWYGKSLPIEDASTKYESFQSPVKHVIQRLLKEYTDLHHIHYDEKQQIATKFGMKLKALEYDYKR